jgi:hypothetical protein
MKTMALPCSIHPTEYCKRCVDEGALPTLSFLQEVVVVNRLSKFLAIGCKSEIRRTLYMPATLANAVSAATSHRPHRPEDEKFGYDLTIALPEKVVPTWKVIAH